MSTSKGVYVVARVEQDVVFMCNGPAADVDAKPMQYVVDTHYLPGTRKVLETLLVTDKWEDIKCLY